ncbi:MAG TPA: YqgE/AlgH family protein [Bryobacteraceae bacterium]|nr:YqgE/AlgH family protein [Bryobacteraceae bacterium]
MRWLPVAAIVLCFGTAVRLAEAQSTQAADLGAGKLLVASPELPDPNFAKTVILLVQYDAEGVVGLILNRRSKVPVSRVLDQVAGAKHRSDPVYAGGPVGRTEVLALVRLSSPSGDLKRVFGDVFVASSKEDMEKTFAPASAADADTLRVYLGYSGWTEEQLKHELDLGAWFIFPGGAKAVFDSNPDSLWDRFIRETELRIAYRGVAMGPARGGGDPTPFRNR